MEKFQQSALQLCAKLRIRQSVSLSNICTGSKAKQVCFHRWRARRGPGDSTRQRLMGHCGHRHPGPPQNAQGDGAKTKAAHACGQAGGEQRVEKTKGRLPRD